MARSPTPSPPRSSPRSRSASPVSIRSRSRSPTPNAEAEACPFLIRAFVTKGKHTPLVDLDNGKFPVRDEYQVWGWKHSTPTSLVQQLYSVLPAPYRSPAARYSFKHVYVDASERGLYRARELVAFTGRDFTATVAPSLESNQDRDGPAMDRELDDTAPAPRRGAVVEEKTLDQYGFITGDLLSVAVHVPEPRAPRANGRDAKDGPPQRDGHWTRAAAGLGPQGPRREGAPAGGAWRGGAPGPRGGRRPSPDWGRRSRSRSPVRRESWSARRRD